MTINAWLLRRRGYVCRVQICDHRGLEVLVAYAAGERAGEQISMPMVVALTRLSLSYVQRWRDRFIGYGFLRHVGTTGRHARTRLTEKAWAWINNSSLSLE